jgi:hypothetical protein
MQTVLNIESRENQILARPYLTALVGSLTLLPLKPLYTQSSTAKTNNEIPAPNMKTMKTGVAAFSDTLKFSSLSSSKSLYQ